MIFLVLDNSNKPVLPCLVIPSPNRQLLLCGMHSGFIRIYPLKPEDKDLTSMQAYWTLSVHDNQYGHLRHIRCSYDNEFVLTAGDDGNIFSFSLCPLAELKKGLPKTKAKVPTPRVSPHFSFLLRFVLFTVKSIYQSGHIDCN